MLEWLSSKLAVALASILLLSSVIAYFVSEGRAEERRELESLARNLASFIDGVIGVKGTAKLEVSYSPSGDFVMPERIGGSAYHLTLRTDSVILAREGESVVGHFSGTLHFWKWTGKPLTLDDVERLDRNNTSLTLVSGEDFEVAIEEVTVDYEDVILGFARPPG